MRLVEMYVSNTHRYKKMFFSREKENEYLKEKNLNIHDVVLATHTLLSILLIVYLWYAEEQNIQ